MPLRRPQLRHDFVEIREVEPRNRQRRNYHPPLGSQPGCLGLQEEQTAGAAHPRVPRPHIARDVERNRCKFVP